MILYGFKHEIKMQLNSKITIKNVRQQQIKFILIL